ncbi:MAG: NADH:ubiquinone oxidoreductase subunit E [Phycisphaerales bacterium]|jgi:NADH:ubiquinone oxidoreductase subunit E
MAWITKNSAADTVDRTGEPQLTDAMKADLRDNYLPRFETTMAALLPALHLIQHHYGWVSRQAMLEIAEFLEVKPADVYDTATFYEEYWTNRKGENLISVCRSIACEFCNATPCTEAVKTHLGIDVGETTPDNKFTLVELECLGSCGTAPVALINEDLHENLTPDELIDLVKRIEAGTYTKGGTGAVKGEAR